MNRVRAAAEAAGHRTETVGLTPPYPVVVGPGLLRRAAEFVRERHVVVVTDDNVGALYARTLTAALASDDRTVATLSVPPGERSKSVAQWSRLLGEMARAKVPRDAAVVALGGGVVGDLAGFVAAAYMRGVALYQFPTSLLAMVDSSVGGKTGLDLPEGKNLVGAFWQPRAVVADVEVLRSLPEREFRQGTVELVKAGYLGDPSLISGYDDDWHPGTSADRLADWIAKAVRVKADVVVADERESGRRATLNLGHTLAHALEARVLEARVLEARGLEARVLEAGAGSGVEGQELPHGDAVAHGLVFAALLARRRGLTDLVDDFRRLRQWVGAGRLPARRFAELEPYIGRDKKAVGGRLRFVLLASPGSAVVVDDVTQSELAAAWSELVELEEATA